MPTTKASASAEKGRSSSPEQPLLTPYLTITNIDQTLKAWSEAFGFEPHVEHEVDGVPVHVEVMFRGRSLVMAGPEGADDDERSTKAPATLGIAAPQTFYVLVDDVDAHYRALSRKRSITVQSKPQDRHWGDRAYTVVDPSGYTWMFATKGGAGA